MAEQKTFASEQEEIDYLWENEMKPVDGIYLPLGPPGLPPWEERIAKIREMTLRDDDVLLFTYPKAGTHWLWEVIDMLRNNTAEPGKHNKVQTMMEFISVDVMNQQPSPRTLNTHIPPSLLPVKEMKARRLKTVHVYRNPKDVAVSAYFMVKSSFRAVAPYTTETFPKFLQEFMFGGRPPIYGSYSGYMRQIHEFQQQNPDVPSFNLAFEDVKKEPVKCVKQLAKFLELSVSDELCEQIAEACSFDNMKKQNALKAPPEMAKGMNMEKLMKTMKSKPVIFRKGQTGDWKNYFTVADSERMDEMIKREMKDLPFTLTFE